MDFQNKLDTVLNNIDEVYHLDEKYINSLKDNIILRTNYYKNIKPSFKNESLFIKDASTIGDFFINRLLNNVRSFEYNYVYNSNNSGYKDYNDKNQTLRLTTREALNDVVECKLKNRMFDVLPENVDKSCKKITAHEIGHALQVNYKGLNGEKDVKHELLIIRLERKNPNTFVRLESKEDLEIIQNGLNAIYIEDEYKAMRNYYSKKEDTSILDDIFNEDEALSINGLLEVQNKYYLGNDCYKNIFNFESFNYKITNYAKEMKLVMGLNRTFKSLYLDSSEFYNYFDSFRSLASSVFNQYDLTRQPVVSCIIQSLLEVKNNNSLYDALCLDLFFSKCLEKRIKFILKHQLSEKDIQTLIKNVDDFRLMTVQCDKARLGHEDILDSLTRLLKRRLKHAS